MTLAARKEALLALVEADRARRCDSVLDEARARAKQAVASAHAEARERVRSAFREERARTEASLRAATARLETHRRLSEQRRHAALLAAARDRLPGALVERWQRNDCRAAWVARAVAEAKGALPATGWTVVHAIPFAEGSMFGNPVTFVADDSLRAGLRVMAGGNVVDGSLAGLLADRDEIGARILAHLSRLEKAP